MGKVLRRPTPASALAAMIAIGSRHWLDGLIALFYGLGPLVLFAPRDSCRDLDFNGTCSS